MKLIRPQDVGGMSVEMLHRLAPMMGAEATAAEGIVIRGRRDNAHGLSVRLLLDGSNAASFADVWSTVESHNPGDTIEPEGRAVALRVARERLQSGQFGDFISPIAMVGSDYRFAILNDVLAPAFFGEYPAGQIHLVEYSPGFNGSLALISTLQRAKILNTADPEILAAYLGSSSMSTFGFQVPAEALYSALTFGLPWSYPTLTGFVGTCALERFLVFILDNPYESEIADATSFDRMLPNMLNIMGDRTGAGLLTPADYIRPSLTRPLTRRRFTVDEMGSYLQVYVDALGETFAWLNDLDNYGKEGDSDILDVDFAQATWLTFFMLLATQFGIATSRVHFARKFSFFDSLELFCALVSSNQSTQTNAWMSFVSDEYARTTLVSQLLRFGAVGAELAVAVTDIRDRAKDTITRGLLYPRNEN